MKKVKVKKATVGELTKYIIENETSVRQVFFKGREAEIDGGKFEIKDIKVFTVLPSLSEYEMYERPEYGPLGNVLFRLNYAIKKGTKWTLKQMMISNGITLGFDMPEEKLGEFLEAAGNHLKKIINVMYKNWREMKPFILDYIDDNVLDKIKLYMIEVNDEIEYYWARNYHDLASIVGVNEGMVRLINVGIQKDMVGQAMLSDIKHCHLFGQFEEVKFLEEQLEKEKELYNKRIEMKQLCASF